MLKRSNTSHLPRRRIYATKGWCAQTNSPSDALALTIRLRRHQHPRQVVPGAAVGDLDHFGDTAHPTQSGLERDNTPADCKSRRAAPPCPAWPASRGARAHRADFSWTAHFQGLHGYTADTVSSVSTGGFRHRQRRPNSRTKGRFQQETPARSRSCSPSSWSLSPCYGPATICALNR